MTTNYVTRFNSGGTPVDTSAPIFDNNGLVGVGVTTGLAEKLEVNGISNFRRREPEEFKPPRRSSMFWILGPRLCNPK